MAYYNEIDPFCCGVLRRRTADGSLPHGHLDERPIQSVAERDLLGHRQFHLFAGIGGFALASRLAGLPEDFSILTGGFPCQPFSLAGKRRGCGDDRFLWPDMLRLIRGAKPVWVLGENVPGLDDANLVLDRVLTDLEESGYEGRAFEIPACGVDAPILRRRIWIVGRLASPERKGLEIGAGLSADDGAECPASERGGDDVGGSHVHQRQGERLSGKQREEDPDASRPSLGALGEPEGLRRAEGRAEGRAEPALRERRHASTVTGVPRLQAPDGGLRQMAVSIGEQRNGRGEPWNGGRQSSNRRSLLRCADGKTRRVPEPESGIQLVASGIPQRMARLKAAGNAICPQVAAEIMRCMLEAERL
jgi:DNA (cytosine-5)-methyltransferase 1